MLPNKDDVLQFWFKTLAPAQWWKKSDILDQTIQGRFQDLHRAASVCELAHWRRTINGRLAEIIVLDQFSRHMYRNLPAAFASDDLALCLSQEAVGMLQNEPALADQHYVFLVMPYMHSESKSIHKDAVKLFDRPSLKSNLRFELRHKEIIDRFGRYPHRNEILGRNSTPEETAFLQKPGSSF